MLRLLSVRGEECRLFRDDLEGMLRCSKHVATFCWLSTQWTVVLPVRPVWQPFQDRPSLSGASLLKSRKKRRRRQGHMRVQRRVQLERAALVFSVEPLDPMHPDFVSRERSINFARDAHLVVW